MTNLLRGCRILGELPCDIALQSGAHRSQIFTLIQIFESYSEYHILLSLLTLAKSDLTLANDVVVDDSPRRFQFCILFRPSQVWLVQGTFHFIILARLRALFSLCATF
jgi:hypothetical protein